ncbi:unconventional prefoldin RPB5 interactor-like protein isoform X2 [Camponotus floridanus]|uniref:unconventional prefoldin RPB5 interactor-like protein isoform X1 n=1 Tax=Camponotus floridanus TaxID=104421 RepID=UPI00059C148D|nr:unconventional prefoldin RPB5 interactor-like protein isoform X1 [Camponotus floridanus]XP_025265249.1 unconventional prefoldin RPB5 interactor-like protein isoform X2 [Camponotus floridanus]
MYNIVANNATMELEQMKNYQRTLLNNVFAQELEQNENQVNTWNDYRNKYKKVIEGLEVYPLSVSENCMVPIGKRALMKGKLIHTNEILVYLGDGYFAKYSASQAISLCKRRIAWADKMLKDLEAERNLYEMKQYLPLKHDIFGEEGRKDILEHWNENKLDEWKILHRQREKEYRQKLVQLREKEKTDICTEEDLFKRLDELELEEELKDEICRLEAEREDSYNDLKEGEVYDESEEDSSDSDEITTETIEEELQKLKDIQTNKITYNIPDLNVDTIQDKILDTNVKTNEHLDLTVNSSQEELKNNHSSESKEGISKATNAKKTGRVSFIEPCITKNTENEEILISSEKSCFISKQDKTHDDSENEEDIIRIEFSHSSHIPNISTSSNTEIQSPIDIYKLFNAPKSILKRSPNDMIPNQIAPLLNEESSTDTENEVEHVKHSIYNSVIKEKVQENKISPMKNSLEKKDEKKVVSRFKLGRAEKKK